MFTGYYKPKGREYKLLKTKWITFKTRLLTTIAVLLVVAAGWFLYIKFEGTEPSVTIDGLSSSIPAAKDISVNLSDEKSGLRSVRMTLTGDGKEAVLLEKQYPAINLIMGGQVFDETLTVRVEPKKHGIKDGRAVFRMTVRDYAWWNWWHGNRTVIEQEVAVDTQPPRVSVLSLQHNLTQGGSGLVIYRTSEPCPDNGVRVGENFFPGHTATRIFGPEAGNLYLCFMALDYTQGRGTPLVIEARDEAGNVARAGFPHYIRNEQFKQDVINISDRFLDRKMPEFETELTEGSYSGPVDMFLNVNRKLRVANTDSLKAITTQNSEPVLYWEEAFLRMPNTARQANFADHREYRYNGDVIDRQVHMGIDLASVARAPVPAANSGKVVFTGSVGIYGGTVIIDHGFGLFSTYSHLSSFNVQTGQIVAKGDTIGQTGTTGLAGGDHLHFGMIVHNTFVDPVEWWDPAWIKNNITGKIAAVKAGNLTVSSN